VSKNNKGQKCWHEPSLKQWAAVTKMVPTKRECADPGFIWGIEDKHMQRHTAIDERKDEGLIW